MLQHAKALNAIDEAQSSLSNRFIKQYGPSGSPARQHVNIVEEEILDEEEDINEEEIEEQDGEEEAEDAHDNMDDE